MLYCYGKAIWLLTMAYDALGRAGDTAMAGVEWLHGYGKYPCFIKLYAFAIQIALLNKVRSSFHMQCFV